MCITPDGASAVRELVMPRLEQQKDAEQQKPSLTGAGIGSGAATRNESAVSNEATQKLSILSTDQSSISPTHLKTYICSKLCTPMCISEHPLSAGYT